LSGGGFEGRKAACTIENKVQAAFCRFG